MITFTEAKQRLNQYAMSIRKTGYGGEYRVGYAANATECRESEPSAYYTDDLLDAVLTGAIMRRTKAAKAA